MLGGAAAFRNFSRAMAADPADDVGGVRQIKDCTDQGLYNLLVYQYWASTCTRGVLLPIERALSYTLGHVTPCRRVAPDGTVLAEWRGAADPPSVHQGGGGPQAAERRALPQAVHWTGRAERREVQDIGSRAQIYCSVYFFSFFGLNFIMP